MSETAQEQTNPAEVPPQKSNKTLIIIVLALVVLLGGGGGGFYFFTSSTASASDDEKESDSKKNKKADLEEDAEDEPVDDSAKDSLTVSLPDDEDVKQIIELPPFIINLADTDEARYLRMTVSLGVGETDGEEEPDQLFLTRVKNAMLSVLSLKTSEEVLSVEGKKKLRKELLKAAQAAAAEPEVEAIYITDFIVQL